MVVVDEVLIRDALDVPESYYGPKLKNFTTVGMGLGKDDKGEYMALVIVFENPEAAEEGFSALEQKIEVYNKLCNEYDLKRALIYDTEMYKAFISNFLNYLQEKNIPYQFKSSHELDKIKNIL